MRRGIAIACVCTACGRLAFDEVALIAPDAPGDTAAAPTCVTTAFDQFPPDMGTFGSGTAVVVNGQARFEISGAVDEEAGFTALTPISFVGHSTAVQIVSPSLTPSASTAMGWHEQTGDQRGVHLEMDGFSLKFNRYNPTLDQYLEVVAVPYDAVEHAWWRLREQTGKIFAEVSRDGVVWNPFGEIEATDTSSMTWDLGIGAYVSNIAPSESTADNAINCGP